MVYVHLLDRNINATSVIINTRQDGEEEIGIRSIPISHVPNSWWKEFDLFFATGRNDRSDRETLSSLRLFSSGGRKGRM